MNIEVDILDGPLPAAEPWSPGDAGAVIQFEGVIRPTEDARALQAMDYQVYEPMTSTELRQLAEEIVDEYRLLAMRVVHSQGRVPVGACSFRLNVAASHRKEALAAMDIFIDRLKQEVPIWKLPVWAGAGAMTKEDSPG